MPGQVLGVLGARAVRGRGRGGRRLPVLGRVEGARVLGGGGRGMRGQLGVRGRGSGRVC